MISLFCGVVVAVAVIVSKTLCRPQTIPGIAMVHYYFIDNLQTMYTRKETINEYNP